MSKDLLGLFVAAFIVATLSACGSGSSSEDDGPAPKSPAEALQRLSDEHRAAFESWKNRLVKSCDGSQAFGLGDGGDVEQLGVDGGVLLNQNHHSAILTGNSGGFVILSGSNSIAGTGSSKVESSVTVNGHSRRIQVELQRQGSDCVVLLYGQKVHQTTIAESFNVAAFWSASATHPAPLRYSTVVKDAASSGLSETLAFGGVDAVTQALAPAKETARFIAARFGLSEDQAARLFRVDERFRRGLPYGNAIRSVDAQPGLWFGSDQPRFIGPTAALHKLFDGSPQTSRFEWRVALPSLSYGDITNDADSGSLKLVATVEISALPDNPKIFSYSVSGITDAVPTPYDSTEASACVTSRIRALRAVADKSNPTLVQPSVTEATSPCHVLSNDLTPQIMADGTLKSLVSEVLAGVVAGSSNRYNGWDGVVSSFALDLIEKDLGAITSELDPQSRAPVVRDVASNLTSLKQLLLGKENLSDAHFEIYSMGLSWSFLGLPVSSDQMSRFVKAADNSILPFKNSTRSLLISLGAQPNGSDDTVAFAGSLTDEYKAEANRARALAQALDYGDWTSDYFDRILQRKLSLDVLRNWSARLERIQTELSHYTGLASIRGSLVRLAVRWTDSGQATLDQIAKTYAALDNVIDPFVESTTQWVSQATSSFADGQAALDFARGINLDYKRLAIAIRNNSSSVGLEDWGGHFFSTVLQAAPPFSQLVTWNATLAAELQFTLREIGRMQGSSGYFNESYRKDLMKKALSETWSGDDFAEVEQIATLGRLKFMCNQYAGVSSILNCLGMSQFGRGTKKFLDPAFSNRYGALAQEFAGDISRMLPEGDYYGLRNSMFNAFFGSSPVWATCADPAYQAKAAALRTQVQARIVETDQIKKWDLERAIGKTLEDCSGPR